MKIEITAHVYLHDSAQLNRIEKGILSLKTLGEKIMAQQQTSEQKLDDAISDITESTTLAESMSGVIAMLRQQVVDEMAKEKVTSSLTAKIDQVFSGAEENRVKLAAAVVASTPAANVPLEQPGTVIPIP